jgi:RHS repeat-associated protein
MSRRHVVMPKFAVLVSLALALSFVSVVQFVAAPRAAKAHADVSTGVAGLFVPNVGRLMDTRNGTGGYSTMMQANVVRSVAAAGVAGIPSTGVSALALTLTVPGGGSTGTVTVTPGDDPSPDQVAANLTYNSGEAISNTALVALHSDGHIKVVTNTATNLIVDVQGYFTSGSSTAAGGFVPVPAARIVNTATGVGAPQAKIAANGSIDVQAGGAGGVPSSATSVYVNVTVSGQAGNGSLRVYPTGGTVPTVDAFGFDSGAAMGQSVVAQLNSAGKFTILLAAGGPANVTVDVQGYFTAGTTNQTFTPAQLHYYDSRQSTPLAAGEVRQIQAVGADGVPRGGDGLTAVTLNMRAIATSTASTGWLRAWADDQAEPSTTNVSYESSDGFRNNVLIIAPGADGKINVRNGGNGPIDMTLDVEGWFSVAQPAAHGGNCTLAGDRAGAKAVSHALTDRSKLDFSPVTGDALLTGQLLHVSGIDQDTNVVWRYNAINDTRPTLNLGFFDSALVLNGDGSLNYTAPDGGCYKFAQSGSTWMAPAGINAAITSPSTGVYELTFYPSGLIYRFADDGSGTLTLVQSRDKYATGANAISYAYGSGHLVTITDTRGKTISFAYTDVNNPTQPSKISDNSLGRTVTIAYGGPNGAMSQITDATGALTTFGYNAAGLVSSITDDRGSQTTLTYGSDKKATGWTYAAGTSAASAWTVTYPSATQTKVTDPNSHVDTYDLNASTNSVQTVTDPNGDHSSATFDAHDNQLSSQTDLGNTSTATWTNNNMLQKATSPAGSAGGTAASISYSYPTGTGNLTNYLPTDATDSQGNETTYGYDNRNDVSTVTTPNGSDGTPAGGTPTTHRQGDSAGTNCSAHTGETCNQTNGNGKTTSYGYDSLGRVTTIAQPAPLSAINYTYDAASRVVTATDGRGDTAYYSYDNDDRTTQISYSATSCPTASCVTYSYDGDGNRTSRVDASGTTSYVYDRLNRPTSKTLNSSLLSSATWDGASNMLTYTDAAGTVTYSYDAGNRLVLLAQAGGSCPAVANIGTQYASPNSTECTRLIYDGDDRRTEVDYPNGQRILLTYFNSGRVNRIKAVSSGGGTLASRAYTYTNTSGADTGLRSSMVDSVAGLRTNYTYDSLNRLTAATDGTTAYSYAYDKAGNRTAAAKTGTTSVNAAYNDADEQCWKATGTGTCTAPPSGASSYAYDTSGNQTTADGNTITVNLFNQISSIQIAGVTTSFSYADTTNTERTSIGATNFINGNLGVTTETTSGASIEYTRDPSGNLISMSTGGNDYYYTADAIGSVILLTGPSTTAASYTYDPWGRITASSGSLAATNPWRYAGGYYDTATGLTKMGARYYDPGTGRFTQPDPSHQEQNNYTYAGNDPINNTDPTGLSVLDSVLTYTGFALDVAALAVGFFFAAPAIATGIALVGLVVGGLAVACTLTNDENGCTGPGG